MSKLDRRSFIKIIGQSAVIMGMGLSKGEALGAEEQTKKTTGKKRPKRIASDRLLILLFVYV